MPLVCACCNRPKSDTIPAPPPGVCKKCSDWPCRCNNPAPARKADDGKAPWHLLAWDAIALVVQVLKFGADKYAARNWEGGLSFSRCFDATQRHLIAWWAGEDNDPETGINHLAHAMCELMFILAFVVRGRKDLDDRLR